MQAKGFHLDVPPSDHTDPLYKVFSSIQIRIEQRLAELKSWSALQKGRFMNV